MKVSAIMTSKGIKTLTENFQKSLVARMTGEGSAESLELLYNLRAELLREAAAGKSATEEIGKLISGLESIRFADELRVFSQRCKPLLAEQFAARASVAALHELSSTFNEKVISTALIRATDLLQQEGRTSPEFSPAVLVSGELGRREAISGGMSSFFFIFQDCGGEQRAYFDELALRYMAVLSLGFPAINRGMFKGGSLFWSGSRSEWEAYVSAPLKGAAAGGEGSELLFSRMFETIADLRGVCGDMELSGSLLAYAGKLVAEEVSGERFWHQAKSAAEMPVALTMFGRFKTERSGKHKGTFPLRELAIEPLIASARVLAVALGIAEKSTIERIKAVLAEGSLGVALADRLLVVWQDFMRRLVAVELEGGDAAGSLFLNPDELDEASRERLKNGLEDIATLQRLVYQQLVEVEL